MATVSGDDNGVLETCDDGTANCQDCDWEHDGAGGDCIAEAEAHVDATGHTVDVSGTYYGVVSP